MKHIARYFLLFAVILFIATSCKKPVPDQTKYIPKDATFVVDLDWKSLSQKASKGNMNWDSLFRSLSQSNDDSLLASGKKKFDDFMNSGVDVEHNVFLFARTSNSIMNGSSTMGGAIAILKDADKFEAYIKRQAGANEIKKGNNYSYSTMGNNVAVGWNKEVVILSGSYTGKNGADSSSSTSSPLQQTFSSLFSQKEDESVAAIPEFRDLLAEKGDILLWTNSGSMLNSVPLLGMTKISDLFKDSYGAGVVNFEDGKVTGTFKSYSGKDLAAIWKKYAGPTADMKMVTQYPLPVAGFAAFSFNPQIIYEIIKYAGFEGTANEFLEKQGLTLNDLLKAFKGDFAIVFSDLGIAEKENNYNGMKFKSKQTVGKLVFNAAIGDKASYDKIVSKLAEQGEMEMQNGQYVPKGFGNELAWSMDGKNLIIATDKDLMQQYLSGKGNAALPADVAAEANGKSVAFYIDINKILQSFPVDSSAIPTMNAAKNTFKMAMSTTENFNGKYVSSNFRLQTMNDKENSLVTLIKFFAAASQQIKETGKRFEHKDMISNDSTDMVPPPVHQDDK
jgi:hypothetical protein